MSSAEKRSIAAVPRSEVFVQCQKEKYFKQGKEKEYIVKKNSSAKKRSI